jgi:hypothetical protein
LFFLQLLFSLFAHFISAPLLSRIGAVASIYFILALAVSPTVAVSKKLLAKAVRISESAMRMPMLVRAGSGAGKSRLLGRLIAWQEFLLGTPQVVIDREGQTIDNFLCKLTRLPETLLKMGHPVDWIHDVQAALWSRVRYIDLGNDDHVVPFPLLYRLGNESLAVIGSRFMEVVKSIDVALASASIEGLNAARRASVNLGMILWAMGLQLTEAEQMVQKPDAWLGRARKVLEQYPDELPRAIRYLEKLSRTDERSRERMTASFFNALEPVILDPAMRATFGAKLPGLIWPEVRQQGLTVLVDGRKLRGRERREFALRWAWDYTIQDVKNRGPNRDAPLHLVVDELATMVPGDEGAANHFAKELDEVINVLARNHSLRLSLATQELGQYSPRLQRTLLYMPIQFQGRTQDVPTAEALADLYFRHDPHKVKKYVPQYMSDLIGPYVVQTLTEEYTPEEQLLAVRDMYLDLPKLTFLVRFPSEEGDVASNELRASIAQLDPGQYPDGEFLSQVRELIMRRDGQPIQAVLAEIDARSKARIELSAKRSRQPVAETRLVNVDAQDEPEEIPVFTIDDA